MESKDLQASLTCLSPETSHFQQDTRVKSQSHLLVVEVILHDLLPEIIPCNLLLQVLLMLYLATQMPKLRQHLGTLK